MGQTEGAGGAQGRRSGLAGLRQIGRCPPLGLLRSGFGFRGVAFGSSLGRYQVRGCVSALPAQPAPFLLGGDQDGGVKAFGLDTGHSPSPPGVTPGPGCGLNHEASRTASAGSGRAWRGPDLLGCSGSGVGLSMPSTPGSGRASG